MANNSPHWLESWTLPWLPEHLGFQEKEPLNRKWEKLALLPWHWVQGLGPLGLWSFGLGILVAGGLGCLGSLALAPYMDGCTHGTRKCQGFRPHMVGSLSLEAGFHTGTHALLGSSLWDSMIQCSPAHGSQTATWSLRTAHLRF